MSHGLFQAFQVCTHNSSHKQTERRDREISLFFFFLFSFQLVGSGAYPLPPPGSGGEAVGVHRGGRQHVRDGVGTIKTEKSGFTVAVTLPILPVLARTLEAGPCGDLTFIDGERGPCNLFDWSQLATAREVVSLARRQTNSRANVGGRSQYVALLLLLMLLVRCNRRHDWLPS
jgi:hypothetical protein